MSQIARFPKLVSSKPVDNFERQVYDTDKTVKIAFPIPRAQAAFLPECSHRFVGNGSALNANVSRLSKEPPRQPDRTNSTACSFGAGPHNGSRPSSPPFVRGAFLAHHC